MTLKNRFWGESGQWPETRVGDYISPTWACTVKSSIFLSWQCVMHICAGKHTKGYHRKYFPYILKLFCYNQFSLWKNMWNWTSEHLQFFLEIQVKTDFFKSSIYDDLKNVTTSYRQNGSKKSYNFKTKNWNFLPARQFLILTWLGAFFNSS